MPRRSRQDEPGAFHHIMNRGQAKRAVFIREVEIRYFLSRMAREVRRGEIEVHGFCILTTHFHLLLRSQNGQLSEAMRRIENAFVRWFNRRHDRDGALFKGRFTSRRINDDCYMENVKHYIDDNAVSANLVARAADYPHGSAYLRAKAATPAWLHGPGNQSPKSSNSTHVHLNDHTRWVIERRLEKSTQTNFLDNLVGSAPLHIQRWLEQNARVADGPRIPHCLLSPDALRIAIDEAREQIGPWYVTPRTRKKDGWSVLELGFCREYVGLSTPETALRLDVARSSAGHAILEHRHLMSGDTTYARLAAGVLGRGLEITFGKGKGRETRDDCARLDLV